MADRVDMDAINPAVENNKSILSKLYDFSATPYLGILNSACILASPFISPAIKVATATTQAQPQSRLVPLSKSPVVRLFKPRTGYVGLTRKNALLFGVSQLLGSWMIYDDDLEDGSGFLMAWSTLYLIVNGKSSIVALKYTRVWPLALSSIALTNLGLYGRRYITSSFK